MFWLILLQLTSLILFYFKLLNLLTVTLCLLSSLVVFLHTKKKKGVDDLPGPFRLPFFGAIHNLPKIMAGKLHEVIDDATKTYGHHAIIKGAQPFTFSPPAIVMDADFAHEILSTNKYMKSSRMAEKSVGILDYALFVMPTGADHKRHRKLAQASFGMDTTRATSVASISACSIFDKEFEISSSLEISSLMAKVTLEIIGIVAFGQNLSSSAAELFSSLEHDISLPILKRFMIPSSFWTWFGIGPRSPAISSTRSNLTNYVRNMVMERKMQNIIPSPCLLDGLIKGEEYDILSDEEVYGEMIGFFFAGHETTSSTLTFALLELARSKEIQDNLFSAIKVLNFDDPSTIFGDISKIDYLDYVLKETQRRHCIVGSLQRNSNQDIEMLGYTFPKGTLMNVSIRGIHLNLKYYDAPFEFIPSRWSAPLKNQHAFLPFGDGGHQCIGKRMAVIEFKVVLAKLLQNYEFSLDPKKLDYNLTSGITHRASNLK
jgi:cytochrome P450